jgi:hypothetical protein
VAGLTFLLQYDADQFRDAEFTWSDAALAGTAQVNYTNDQVYATLSLPRATFPDGTQAVGQLSLRARSVAGPTNETVSVVLSDVADTVGNTFAFGNDTDPAVVSVLPRRITGDNNGNDRLDIGDATIIQRFLVVLETPRPWDITGNDLNGNTAIDSGDVIKVLRVVVGLDPQPEPAPGGLAVRNPRDATSGEPDLSASAPITVTPAVVRSSSTPEVVLAADRRRAAAGESIIVQVCLQGLPGTINGASFALHYPAQSLHLVNTNSLRTGAMVPSNVMALWNVSPSCEAQTGRVSCALSSATAWESTSGVLAELTFQVQGGADSRSTWPLLLDNVEAATDNGYDPYAVPATSLTLNPLPVLAANVVLTKDGPQLSFTGLAGSNCAIEFSSDLQHWDTIWTGVDPGGPVVRTDTTAGGVAVRFYRVKEW